MKRVFFITALLALAGAAVAQTHVLAEAQLPDDATKMIVRDYLSPATVSYIATASQNFFAYADAGNRMTCIPLDSKYDVCDMKIQNGNVYFCGQDVSITQAFLGWFNVMDVIQRIDGYHIYNNFNTIPTLEYSRPEVALSFDQLEVYQGATALHIALVGKTTNLSACIVDVQKYNGSLLWDYSIACPNPNLNTETLTNIVQNGNYFITGGTYCNNHEAVSMRFFKKDSMLTSGTGNRIYRYTSGHNPNVCYPRAKFAMATIGDDTVATASYWSYLESTDPLRYNRGYEGILVNAYVISATLADVPLLHPAFSVKCSYFQPISESVIERMIYSKYDNHLYLLGRHGTPIGLQSMISRISIPPSTTINSTYLPDYNFTDIDSFYSCSRYVCSGFRSGEAASMAYYSKPTGPTYQCAQKYLAPVTDANFTCKVEEEYLMTLRQNQVFTFSTTMTIEPFSLYIDINCQH